MYMKINILSALHQNKALHSFHKKRRLPIVGRIKGLDESLMGHPTWLVLRLE